MFYIHYICHIKQKDEYGSKNNNHDIHRIQCNNNSAVLYYIVPYQ